MVKEKVILLLRKLIRKGNEWCKKNPLCSGILIGGFVAGISADIAYELINVPRKGSGIIFSKDGEFICANILYRNILNHWYKPVVFRYKKGTPGYAQMINSLKEAIR